MSQTSQTSPILEQSKTAGQGGPHSANGGQAFPWVCPGSAVCLLGRELSFSIASEALWLKRSGKNLSLRAIFKEFNSPSFSTNVFLILFWSIVRWEIFLSSNINFKWFKINTHGTQNMKPGLCHSAYTRLIQNCWLYPLAYAVPSAWSASQLLRLSFLLIVCIHQQKSQSPACFRKSK